MVKNGIREPSEKKKKKSPLAARYSRNYTYFIEIQVKVTMPLAVAVRSKAYFCSRSAAGTKGADFAEAWMLFLVVVVCCVYSVLYDELITYLGESYSLFLCLIVCDSEPLTMRWHRPKLCSCVTVN
jgi:hypothetical protein